MPPSSQPRFFPVPQHALFDKHLSPSSRTILGYFASWWWGTGECFPSIARIAKETNVNPRTVNKGLNRLVRWKYVLKVPQEKSSGFQDTNLYLPGPAFHPNPGTAHTGTPAQAGTLLHKRTKGRHNGRFPTRQQLLDHGSKAPDGLLRGGSDAFYNDDDRLK
jgi:hypothetical protein